MGHRMIRGRGTSVRDAFKTWLAAQGYTEKTTIARLSNLTRIEAAYGPLDALIAQGLFDSLIDDLTYTIEDEGDARPNPSRVRISGSLHQGLTSLRDAASIYQRFVQNTATADDGEKTLPPRRTDPEDHHRQILLRDMRRTLRQDLSSLEPGLRIAENGQARPGAIDILATDPEGARVAIVVTASRADAGVVGQTLGCMGDLIADDPETPVRGIIVAQEFDPRTRAAARVVPNLRLYSYGLAFTFRPAG